MSTPFRIWLSPPDVGEAERRYVAEAFDTNWIAPLGPHVDAFEARLGETVGMPHVAALSSGTAALHLAMVLLGVGPGDEVVVQSFTFAASANPVVYLGATPVFVDSERDTWNMCPGLLRECLASRAAAGKRPKAVVAVHLYGTPYRSDEIAAACKEFDVPLVEDAAEALGSTYKGRPAGSLGDLSVLSFNGNKMITTSGGGALAGRSAQVIARARFLATQARDDAPHYEHSTVGYNYRLSNVCAGIGLGQLESLPEKVARRRSHFAAYRSALGGLPGVRFPADPEGCGPNRWLSTLVIDPASSGGVTREDVRLRLARERIESRPLWKPLHRQPVFRDAPFVGGDVASSLFEEGLCLPSGSSLTDAQRDEVVGFVRESFDRTEAAERRAAGR